MPKARRRYNTPGRITIGQQRATPTATIDPARTASTEAAQRSASPPSRLAKRRAAATRAQGMQSLVWPIMVTLGCWGLAYTFLFYSTNPNHYIFGGMAILMALMWTFVTGLRVRKLRQAGTPQQRVRPGP